MTNTNTLAILSLLKKNHTNTLQCPRCGADPQKPSWDKIPDIIERCPSCHADVILKGKWNGTALSFLSNLYKQNPHDTRWKDLIPKIEAMMTYSWKT